MVGRRLASSPPYLPTQIDAHSFCNAAEIRTHHRLNLFEVREAYRRACAEAVQIAFPAPSRHGCATLANRVTGVSNDTFTRILAGSTQSPDAVVMGLVAGIYRARTGRVCPALALMMQIGGAA